MPQRFRSAAQAIAADMPPNPPQVIIQQVPVPVVQEFNGWYLRGDIGMTNQKVKEISTIRLFATAPGFTWLDKGEFTQRHELRSRRRLSGQRLVPRSTSPANIAAARIPRARQLSTMAARSTPTTIPSRRRNGCSSPTPISISAPGGASRRSSAPASASANLTIGNFRDTNIIAGGGGWAKDNTETNFAWALHAGAAYNVTQNFAIELSYRYLNLGDGKTGDTHQSRRHQPRSSNPDVTFKDITSHDVRLGVRWTCCDDNIVAGAPARRLRVAAAGLFAAAAAAAGPPGAADLRAAAAGLHAAAICAAAGLSQPQYAPRAAISAAISAAICAAAELSAAAEPQGLSISRAFWSAASWLVKN